MAVEPLSSIASITPAGDELVAILRGEVAFAGDEELLTRLIPLLADTGCLVLDFTAVTRVASGAAQLLSVAPARIGDDAAGQSRVVLRDPERVLAER